MRQFLLLLITFSATLTINAQTTATISGKVNDQQNPDNICTALLPIPIL